MEKTQESREAFIKEWRDRLDRCEICGVEPGLLIHPSCKIGDDRIIYVCNGCKYKEIPCFESSSESST